MRKTLARNCRGLFCVARNETKRLRSRHLVSTERTRNKIESCEACLCKHEKYTKKGVQIYMHFTNILQMQNIYSKTVYKRK